MFDELKRVAEKEKNSRVRSRAKWTYEQISGCCGGNLLG
jgi:hypothetical protein